MHWGALLTIIRCVASSGLSRIAVLSGCPFTWVIVFCAPTDQRTGKDDPVPSESDRAAAVGAVHRDRMRRLADGWPRFRAAGFAMRIVGSGGVFGMLLGSVGRVEHDAVVACCELDFGDAFAARRFSYVRRAWMADSLQAPGQHSCVSKAWAPPWARNDSMGCAASLEADAVASPGG